VKTLEEIVTKKQSYYAHTKDIDSINTPYYTKIKIASKL